MSTEMDVLNTEELSPEDKKKFEDYENRLTTFQEKLKKLEEKYQVRAQMTYRMIYADLKLYNEMAEIKDKKDAKVKEVIDKAVEEIVENNK
jgi:predicted naringenin-chalcone synthase